MYPKVFEITFLILPPSLILKCAFQGSLLFKRFCLQPFSPKDTVFYSLFSSLSSWGIAMLESQGKIFWNSGLQIGFFREYQLRIPPFCHFCHYSVIVFFCQQRQQFLLEFSSFNGLLTKRWQERYIQLPFMRVCKYLTEKVKRMGE